MVATAPATAPERRSQAERSDATRGRLLGATIDLLVEVGWARTTTQLVAERAGLSRGAQLHHFPTKADLVVSAVTYLADRRLSELHDELATGTPGPDVGRALAVVERAYSGPLFLASLELWVAARTDPDLRRVLLPVERTIGLRMRELCRELFGQTLPEATVALAGDLTVDLMRGMGIAVLLVDDEGAARRRARLLDGWQQAMRGLLAGGAAGSGAAPDSSADPAGLDHHGRDRPAGTTTEKRS